MLLQSYQLNVVPDQRIGTVTVNASQYDKESRTIRMTMYNGEVPFQIPADANVYVIGTKADNTGYQYECSYVANTNQVTFDIQPQMTVLPGFHMAEIRVTKDGEILGSANFKFQIERGALSDDTVISDTDLPLVEKAAEAVDALEDVTDAIEEANAILSQIDPIAEAVQANALKSEGYAVGEQDGEPVTSESPYYENNAKYYSTEAATSAANAHTSEVNAGNSETNALSYKNSASQSASDALGYKNASSSNATASANEALKSEGYAVGKQNGTDVSSGTYYHNNAKYYSTEAATSATNAHTSEVNAGLSESSASGSATNASNSALVSEGFAVGQQNGTDVSSGSPYYENNAKYYAEKAEDWADEAQTVVENKADYNGYYPDMTVGESADLLGKVKTQDSFIYQETNYDGYADFSVKGNTIVWNQLVKNGDFSDGTTNWRTYQQSVTISVSNNVMTIAASSNDGVIQENLKTYAGHKYFVSYETKSDDEKWVSLIFGTSSNASLKTPTNNGSWIKTQGILTPSADKTNIEIYEQQGGTFDLRNVMIIDITPNYSDFTLPSQFASLFPLSYYAHDSGRLLSFNGTGIKTVGKNFFDKDAEDLKTGYAVDPNTFNEYLTSSGTWSLSGFTRILPNKTYTVVGDNNDDIVFYDENKQPIIGYSTIQPRTAPSNAMYCKFDYRNAKEDEIMLIINGEDTTYEPYHTSTLSLPISTYFPNGMRSAGSVYDELRRDKAITRIGSVDLGSFTWGYDTDYNAFYTTTNLNPLPVSHSSTALGNSQIISYEQVGSMTAGRADKTYACGSSSHTAGKVYIKDTSFEGNSSAFKTAMSGVYLDYEMATPTEVSITPPLDLHYPIVKGGTEQLLPENTSTPTTSPLSRDVTFLYEFDTVGNLAKILNSIAQVETSPTTHAYSSGDYLIYKYQLYRVTSSIANGGTLTVGTNITATTVMSELLSLTA